MYYTYIQAHSALAASSDACVIFDTLARMVKICQKVWCTRKYGRLWQPIFLPYWYRRFCIWKLFGITYIRHVLECLCTIITYKYTALWRHRPTHALYSTNWPVLQNFIQKLIKTLHVCSTLAMFTGCFLNILDVLSHTAGSDTIFESSSFWGQY